MRFSRTFLAVLVFSLLTRVLSAQTLPAATLTATQLSLTTFQYQIVLHHTGNGPLGIFWFAWAPSTNRMPAPPLSVTAPANWTGQVTHNEGDGYGILWSASTDQDVLPSGGTLAFSFTSTMTPAQFTASGAGTSTAYSGRILGVLGTGPENGVIFAVQLTAPPAPALTTAISHIGNFTLGQIASYQVAIQNSGTLPSTGSVGVTLLLSPGFQVLSLAGRGWDCNASTLLCTRSDALAPASAYPPLQVTSNIAYDSPAPATIQANLTGGGSTPVTTFDTATLLAPFADVDPADPFLPAIDYLREYGIPEGCNIDPPLYCPAAFITRSDMAVFVVRAITFNDDFSYSQTPYFSDVPATHPHFKWIQKARDLGITTGCSPITYCPDDPVSRAQMAVFIIRARYGTLVPFAWPPSPYFTDLSASSGFFPWVQKLKQLGITNGCTSTTFCPDDSVTRGQMAVFLSRGLLNLLLPDSTPVIVNATVARVQKGSSASIVLNGQNTNWVQGLTQMTPQFGLVATNLAVIGPNLLSVTISVSSTAADGPYSLTASTGTEDATLPNGLVVW